MKKRKLKKITKHLEDIDFDVALVEEDVQDLAQVVMEQAERIRQLTDKVLNKPMPPPPPETTTITTTSNSPEFGKKGGYTWWEGVVLPLEIDGEKPRIQIYPSLVLH